MNVLLLIPLPGYGSGEIVDLPDRMALALIQRGAASRKEPAEVVAPDVAVEAHIAEPVAINVSRGGKRK